jgi:hypothetical protein
MQPELRARLEQAAQKSGRSLNAEIVARLEKSLAAWSSAEDAPVRTGNMVVHFEMKRLPPEVQKAFGYIESAKEALSDFVASEVAKEDEALPKVRRNVKNKKASD